MERRGFLGRILAAVAVAPAVVVAKKAAATPVLPEIKPIGPPFYTGGIDSFIKSNVWTVPKSDTSPLSKLIAETSKKSGRQKFAWLTKEEFPTRASFNIGKHLGMDSLEVARERYEWSVRDESQSDQSGREVMYTDFNYLQIVRTPVMISGRDLFEGADIGARRDHALREHLRAIKDVLQHGRRERLMVRENGLTTPTLTGGRAFFGSSETGLVAYMRNRGLVWRTWLDSASDVLHGEWLSDIGWAP